MEKKKIAKESPHGISHAFSRQLVYPMGAFMFLSIFLISVHLAVFDTAYYQSQFRQRMGEVDFEEYSRLNSEVLDYLSGKQDSLSGESFTEREILHMADVKLLFKKGYALLGFSLAVAVVLGIFFWHTGRRDNSFRGHISASARACAAIAGIALALAALAAMNFGAMFEGFHGIFFSNDLWLLDPETALIVMYPQSFFEGIAGRILGNMAVMAALLFAIAELGKKAAGKSKKHK